MKRTQLVTTVVVIALIIGGIAFGVQFLTNRTTEPGSAPPPPQNLKQFTFFSQPAEDPEGRPLYSVGLKDEVEVNKPGRCDFPFENKNEVPLEFGLELKGCTCQTVEAIVLDPPQASKIPNWPPVVQDRVGADAFLGPQAPWKHLEDKGTLVAPPGSRGFIRLGWSTKQVHPVFLKAAIWTQAPGSTTRDLVILQVGVNIVAGVQVYPEFLRLKAVDLGQKASVTCWCWSATRDSFSLLPRLEQPNPGIHFTAKPLNAQERQELKEKDSKERSAETQTQVRCGYKVTVELSNDPSGPPLDIGAFENTIHFNCEDSDVAAIAKLNSVIRGVVSVVTGKPEERDLFILGRFEVDEGVSKEFAIEADDPNMELKLDSYSPHYLKVTGPVKDKDEATRRGPDEPGHWTIKLTVPPNVASGRLPRGSHVMLITNEKTPRRVRIPVLGNAIKEKH
jgi:hypothetical protein